MKGLLCISTCFLSPKEIWRGFSLLWKKVQSNSSIQSLFFSEPLWRGTMHPHQWVALPNSFPRTIPSMSASNHHTFEVCSWASVFYFYLFYASASKLWLEVSKISRRSCKGIMLSIQLDGIKHIWYDLVGNVSGTLKIFLIYIDGYCFFSLCHFSWLKVSLGHSTFG